MRGRPATAALAVGATACALVAAAPRGTEAAQRPQPAIVTVNDFYFSPDLLTIHKGRTVKWIWSQANAYPHDVHLKRGPRRLKDRSSYSTRTSAVSEASFKKTFERAGTYRYVCTIHPTQMKLTITVKS